MYSFDIGGTYGYSIMMTGNNSALRCNNNWEGSGTDVLTLNANGNASLSNCLNLGGALIANSFILSYDVCYVRNSYHTRTRSDSGSMNLEMGYVGTGGSVLRLGAYTGNTQLDSGESRNI